MKHGGHHDGALSVEWDGYFATWGCPAGQVDLNAHYAGELAIDDITVDRNLNGTGWDTDIEQGLNPFVGADISLLEGDSAEYRFTGRIAEVRVTGTLQLGPVAWEAC